MTAIPEVLRERASLQPGDPAFTYVDYDQDPAGISETLTWSQMYRRVRAVAAALRAHGGDGDRALILAPQGLDYVAAFLGALEAGFVAVPLSVPLPGTHDERVNLVLGDCDPVAILTTSAVFGSVGEYLEQQRPEYLPALIEVDTMASDGARGTAGDHTGTALLQYTSGSTRQPTGVMVSHRNLVANFEQVMTGYYGDTGGVAPPGTTVVSWLPFYHDMGLFIGVCAPILAGLHSVLTSPVAFLVRPARWMQLMADHNRVFTPAPNFALELAVRKTTDDDMAGRDLAGVTHVVCGAERIHVATVRRFLDRFAPYHVRPESIRPSYGLAEATVYVAARAPGYAPNIVHFAGDKLSAGHAERSDDRDGTALLSYGVPLSPAVRIVEPETATENPAGRVGEIWVHGDNVAQGYWGQPEKSAEVFEARLTDPSPGTPADPWLRTGDLGVISDGELFIVGRSKDLVIIDGRNHYPDDLEATVQEISGGRVAAISVPGPGRERLVLVVELRIRPDSAPEEAASRIDTVKRAVTAAISLVHTVSVADVVLVAPGSIPITTSGKIRRAACADRYRGGQFTRLG